MSDPTAKRKTPSRVGNSYICEATPLCVSPRSVVFKQPRNRAQWKRPGAFLDQLASVDLTAGNGGDILYPHFPMERDDSPATKGDLTAAVDNLRSEIMGRFDEERRHTAVLFEQLKHDVLGAVRDFSSVQQDKQENHERRIQRLERISGVMAA